MYRKKACSYSKIEGKMHRLISTLLFLSSLLYDGKIYAKDTPVTFIPESGIPGCNFKTGELTAECIPNYIGFLIQQVFAFTGAIFLIVLIIGGYQYAFGNIAGGKEKGMERIRFGIIGMIVCALSFFIIDFIISTIAYGS